MIRSLKRRQYKYFMNGTVEKALGRILGIEKNMYLYRIKKYVKEIEKNAANEREKNRIYVITLVSREKT